MTKNLVPFTDAEEKIIARIAEQRAHAVQRFPLSFALLVTFGFVATLYGFEKLIDRVQLFVDHPWILLATGIITLVATGAAYQKLS